MVRKRILNYRMDVVSFGKSDQLSVPQYQFKIIVIAFRLLVYRKISPHIEAVLLLVQTDLTRKIS